MRKIIKYIVILELILILIFFIGYFIYEAKHQKQNFICGVNSNIQSFQSGLGTFNNSESILIRENLYTSID
jgi:hypothetical protein